MNTTDQCQSDRQCSLTDLLGYSGVCAMVLLSLGVGVPIALVVFACAICVALPDEWQFGSEFVLAVILIDSFPCGGVLSGLGCWVLGRLRSSRQRTYVFSSLPLERWGLLMAGLGLLTVGIASVAVGMEFR